MAILRDICYNDAAMKWITNNETETFALGEELGRQAKAGEIYCLDGDLGVGKTVFTKGFAVGLGVEEPITSPTFTIVQEYHDGRLPLYHFDVYRLGDPEEMEEIGCDEYFYGDGVCLIEWASLVEEIIPRGAKWLEIRKDLSLGCDYRRITERGEE